MHLTHRVAAGVLAASLVASGATSVFAKTHGNAKKAGNRAAAYGQVSGLSTSGFTLTTIARTTKSGKTVAARAITVATTATTRITPRKGQTGALANGDYAVVLGSRTGTSIAAARVVFSTQAFQRAAKEALAHRVRRAAGTVTSSTGTSLTIQTRAGKALSFVLTGRTHFRVDGTKATSAPTLTAGEKVRVRFTVKRADRSRVARLVVVRTAAAQ